MIENIVLIRMYPVKTKVEPKARAGFLTNYQPKSMTNHICYKNATQSRGNLVSVQIDKVLILHNARNIHDYNSGGVLNSLCISLEQICWSSIDY